MLRPRPAPPHREAAPPPGPAPVPPSRSVQPLPVLPKGPQGAAPAPAPSGPRAPGEHRGGGSGETRASSPPGTPPGTLWHPQAGGNPLVPPPSPAPQSTQCWPQEQGQGLSPPCREAGSTPTAPPAPGEALGWVNAALSVLIMSRGGPLGMGRSGTSPAHAHQHGAGLAQCPPSTTSCFPRIHLVLPLLHGDGESPGERPHCLGTPPVMLQVPSPAVFLWSPPTPPAPQKRTETGGS